MRRHDCILRVLYNYILTPWSRVLLEKLTGSQQVNKLPAFYGTRMFITAFTGARHLSLSWARSIQSISPHPTSWRSILIFFPHLRLGLPSGLFPSGFPTKTFSTIISTPFFLCSYPSFMALFRWIFVLAEKASFIGTEQTRINCNKFPTQNIYTFSAEDYVHFWCLTFGGLCSASRICIKLYATRPEGRLYEKRRSVAEFLIRPSWL